MTRANHAARAPSVGQARPSICTRSPPDGQRPKRASGERPPSGTGVALQAVDGEISKVRMQRRFESREQVQVPTLVGHLVDPARGVHADGPGHEKNAQTQSSSGRSSV